MKIEKILSQHRRDFTALFKCEFCGYEYKSHGYDDDNFHQNVVPAIICKSCGKQSGEDYTPLIPRYPADALL